jgi:hypothetical protein
MCPLLAEYITDLIGPAISVVNVPDINDREARQDRLDAVDPDAFEDLDEAFYALEASTDLDAVMRTLMPGPPSSQPSGHGQPEVASAERRVSGGDHLSVLAAAVRITVTGSVH